MDLDLTSLRRVDPQLFEALMQRLVELEGHEAGVPPGIDGVSFQRSKQGDGGVDALVSVEPATPTELIPGRRVFQAKLTLDLAKLERQLRTKAQTRVRKLLRDGAGYTLVVAQHVRAERQTELSKTLRRVVGRSVNCSIVGLEQLGRWLVRYPSLLADVPALSKTARHLRSFTQWEAGLGRPMPWTPDKARVAALAQASSLTAGARLRVTGAAGVGKTRFVLEALRSRAAEVTYLSEYVEDAENLVASDTPVRGVLVIDRCSEAQDLRLRSLHRSGIALITIGSEEDPAGLPAESELRLGPLSTDAMHRLGRSVEGLDAAACMELVAHSGGFPGYFALLVDAASRASKEDSRVLPRFDRREIRQLTERLLGAEAELEAIRALALPTWVDVSPGSTDLMVLAEATGTTEKQLQRAIERLQVRRLLGKTNQLVYVTPRILAEQLALGFWGQDFVGARFEALCDAQADPELLERCLDRLERGSPDATAVLVRLAADPRLLAKGLSLAQLCRVLRHLADASPREALCIAQKLHAQYRDWLHELGVVLARAARDESAFSGAVEELAEELAVRPLDDETHLLSDLFASHPPMTGAGPRTRLAAPRSSHEGSRSERRGRPSDARSSPGGGGQDAARRLLHLHRHLDEATPAGSRPSFSRRVCPRWPALLDVRG